MKPRSARPSAWRGCYARRDSAAQENEIDAAACCRRSSPIKAELEVVRGLKTQLTSIGNSATEVAAGLDRLRDQVLARVAEAEAQLQAPVGD